MSGRPRPGLPPSDIGIFVLCRRRWLQLVFRYQRYRWITLGIWIDMAYSLSHLWQRSRFSVALPLGINGAARGGQGAGATLIRCLYPTFV